MVQANGDIKRVTAINKRVQDGSCVVGNGKELPGLFAFKFDP